MLFALYAVQSFYYLVVHTKSSPPPPPPPSPFPLPLCEEERPSAHTSFSEKEADHPDEKHCDDNWLVSQIPEEVHLAAVVGAVAVVGVATVA